MINIWLWLGHLKQIVGQMGTYFSLYSMVATSMILWRVVIKPLLDEYQLNIGLEWFIAAIVVFFTLLGLMEKSKGLHGFFQSWVQHFYTPDNPMRKDIEEMKADIKAMRAEKEKNEASKS